MKHFLNILHEFFTSRKEITALRHMMQTLEYNLTQYDYDWYERNVQLGVWDSNGMSNMREIRERRQLELLNVIEALSTARQNLLRKRMMVFTGIMMLAGLIAFLLENI